jgi:hypothetical protein
MVRKTYKTGNRMNVSLPKNSMDPPGVENGADVSAALDHARGQIIAQPAETPAVVAGVDADLARQLSEFITKYQPALKSLAKK